MGVRGTKIKTIAFLRYASLTFVLTPILNKVFSFQISTEFSQYGDLTSDNITNWIITKEIHAGKILHPDNRIPCENR